MHNLVPAERLVLRCFFLYILVRGLAEAEPFDLLLPLWGVVLLSALIGKHRKVVTEASALQISESLCPERGT